MRHLKAIYWVAAFMAIASWLVCLTADVMLVAGDARLVLWLGETASRFPVYTVILGCALFAAFTAALGARWTFMSGSNFRAYRLAMRGGPRWLVIAMCATVAYTALRVLWAIFAASLSLPPGPTLEAALPSAFMALISPLLVSGARLGVGTLHCENGHPLGRDMLQCSLCGAPAKGLLF